jgi:hypothetical protein
MNPLKTLFICASLVALANTLLFAKPQDGFASYKVIPEKNVFRPLWASGAFNGSDDTSRKEEMEALRSAELERQRNQKTAEAQAELDNKKKEIEENYSLNGIVFENGSKQAVIQSKKGGAYLVFKGDTIDNMEVLSIDDVKGEAVLDCQGKFTVTLKMEN